MSATLLPVLVKCCVLSKQQPRMCQPSRLTLPNGLLNADIKLTRSFALPFSSLSLFLPLLLALITSCSHPFPHCHSLVLCLSFSFSVALSINLSLSVFFFFPVAVTLLPLTSPSITLSSPLKRSCRLSLYLQLFLWMNSTLQSLSTSLSHQAP